MTLCNTACSAWSVGVGASTNAGTPTSPRKYTSGTARRAEPAPLATDGHQLVVAAVATPQSQMAVGQDAALEEGA
jgi:hypothetical protein